VTTHPPDESESSHPVSGDDTVSAILTGSHVVASLRSVSTHVASWVRNSGLYQWLTAEPDPEVIVIDLRETWTVGPFLRVLGWVVDRFGDAAADSRAVGVAQRGVTTTYAAPMRVLGVVTAVFGLLVATTSLRSGISMTRLAVGFGLAVGGVVAMQDERDWATLRETRAITLVIAALEPPEPPETTADAETPTEEKDHHPSADPSESAGIDSADSQQKS